MVAQATIISCSHHCSSLQSGLLISTLAPLQNNLSTAARLSLKMQSRSCYSAQILPSHAMGTPGPTSPQAMYSALFPLGKISPSSAIFMLLIYIVYLNFPRQVACEFHEGSFVCLFFCCITSNWNGYLASPQ